MKHLLCAFALLLLASAMPSSAQARSGTSFYVCAHPDDCLLFMNPNLYNDVTTDAEKVVVVYLTSGEAGGLFNRENPSYARVRELSSIEASDWMADVDVEPVNAEQKVEHLEIAGRKVERVSYAHTVSYLLRLPDGNVDGSGYPSHDGQSLIKLKEGRIDKVVSIDGTATYRNWQDLLAVLSGIIDHEAPEQKAITVHVSEPELSRNPADHSDHVTGASAMVEVLQQRAQADAERCTHLYRHIGYSITAKEPNLDVTGLERKAASFAVMSAAQRKYQKFHHWNKTHQRYLPFNYYAEQHLPEGCTAAQ